jgi:hypothetical protein
MSATAVRYALAGGIVTLTVAFAVALGLVGWHLLWAAVVGAQVMAAALASLVFLAEAPRWGQSEARISTGRIVRDLVLWLVAVVVCASSAIGLSRWRGWL